MTNLLSHFIPVKIASVGVLILHSVGHEFCYTFFNKISLTKNKIFFIISVFFIQESVICFILDPATRVANRQSMYVLLFAGTCPMGLYFIPDVSSEVTFFKCRYLAYGDIFILNI